MDRQLVSMLGLCKKAGMLLTGSFSCERAMQDGKAKLVLVSAGASGNTKKKFSQKAFYYGVPYKELVSVGDYSHINTQNPSVAVVTSKNFSAKILSLIGVDTG